MTELKCACGGLYEPVPDEEATTMPPSFTARLLHCQTCGETEWREAEEVGLEDWPDSDTVVS